MTIPCPICACPSETPARLNGYRLCSECGLGFQHPLPPKVFEGDHEPIGSSMDEAERNVNRGLAGMLFARALKGKPGRTLDVGAKYPFLARCLKDLGCTSYAMDGIDAADDFGRELGVPMLHGDFEGYPFPTEVVEADKLESDLRFDLVTLVHCFEHLYDPLAAILKLRRIVSPKGAVFLRIPDHEVPGYEPNLAPSHLVIHPFFHTLTSVLEILAQAERAFVVEDAYTVHPGQRDIVLRAISRTPRVHAGMICKNEERDVGRAIYSLSGVADHVYMVDTGSTDATLGIAVDMAEEAGITPNLHQRECLTHSNAEGLIEDFAGAKNEFLADIDALAEDGDVVLWLDADDEILTPRAIRRRAYEAANAVVDIPMTRRADGGGRWTHCRMWPAKRGIRFEGLVHEFPSVPSCTRRATDSSVGAKECLIRHHDGHAKGQEEQFARNYRILRKAWDTRPDQRTPRNAFYLAQSAQGLGKRDEAIEAYRNRIGLGIGYGDDCLLASLELDRELRAKKELGEAEKAVLATLPNGGGKLAEVWLELARIEYEAGRYMKAIAFATTASATPKPAFALWLEDNAYADQPLRLISWCYEHLGRWEPALEYALLAEKAIGGPDADWSARIDRLRREVLRGEGRATNGDELSPSYSQHGQDRIVWEHYFAGSNSLAHTYLDVGASDGREWNNTLLFDERGWRGVCVEPIPEVFARLHANRPRATCLQMAVDGLCRKGSLLRLKNERVRTELMSGLTDRYDHGHLATVMTELHQYGGSSEAVPVECIDLNTLMRMERITAASFLSLDVEGAEIAVLSTWDHEIYPIDVISVEANTLALADKTVALLESKDYVLEHRVGHDLIFRRSGFVPQPARPPSADPPDAADERTNERADARTKLLAASRVGRKPRIGLLRPGAIGDVIMTLNLVPLLKQRFPEHEVHYVTRSGMGLGRLMAAAGVDRMRVGGEILAGEYDKTVNLIGYPLHEGYPSQPMRRHLIRYFADEMGLELDAREALPALVCPLPALPRRLAHLKGPYATFQVKTGWSRYKEWPLERWVELADRIVDDITLVQIGSVDEPRVPGTVGLMLGAEMSETIEAVAHANLHIGLDSFANHLTHVRWLREDASLKRTPGVILWGSTQPSASGYETNTNLVHHVPCAPCFKEDPAVSAMSGGPCRNPPDQTYDAPKHACMAGLSVDLVETAVRRAWEGRRPPLNVLQAGEEMR